MGLRKAVLIAGVLAAGAVASGCSSDSKKIIKEARPAMDHFVEKCIPIIEGHDRCVEKLNPKSTRDWENVPAKCGNADEKCAAYFDAPHPAASDFPLASVTMFDHDKRAHRDVSATEAIRIGVKDKRSVAQISDDLLTEYARYYINAKSKVISLFYVSLAGLVAVSAGVYGFIHVFRGWRRMHRERRRAAQEQEPQPAANAQAQPVQPPATNDAPAQPTQQLEPLGEFKDPHADAMAKWFRKIEMD